MKTDKCPSLGKAGLSGTIIGLFQSLFVGRKHASERPGFRAKSRKARISIPNAGYQLSVAQVRQIIDACDFVRDRVLIQTFAFTGLRRAEAAALQVDDILWDRKLLLIRCGKGGKQRLIPLPKKLLGGFRELIGSRKQGPLFVSRCGQQLSVRQVNRLVARAGAVAGVKHPNPRYRSITCHLFRHTFARLWKDRQGSIETLSTILGHQSVRTTWDVYGKESLRDIRDNYEKTFSKMLNGD